MLDLTDLQAEVALIVGFFLPLAIAVIVRVRWSPGAKAICAFVVYCIAGGVTAWAAGDLSGKTFWQCAVIILITGIASYRALWHPTGIAPQIEESTG